MFRGKKFCGQKYCWKNIVFHLDALYCSSPCNFRSIEFKISKLKFEFQAFSEP